MPRRRGSLAQVPDDAAQRLSAAALNRYRTRALLEIVRAERRFDAAFRRLAAELHRELLDAGLDELQVQRALARAFARLSPERQAAIEQAIIAATRHGIDVGPDLHRRVFGDDASAPEAELPFVEPSGSPPKKTPSLRLVRGSGGKSLETG